jgi:prephenate dehydrogenase
MAGLTYAQKLAFGQTVAQFLQDHAAELRAAGFNPTKKLAALQKSLLLAIQQDAKQEALKAELVKTTNRAVKSLDSAYKQASSLTDAMVGVFGKDDPVSKRLRQLRDQMAKEALRGRRAVKVLK